MVGISKLCSIMAVDNEEIALATANLFQCVYDSLTGGDQRNYGKEEALVLGKRGQLSKWAFRGALLMWSCWPSDFWVLKVQTAFVRWLVDSSRDLKDILLALLEMIASKKVSGHGRDQALNLLTRNVPRKDKKDTDHSKCLFTIDHGMFQET